MYSLFYKKDTGVALGRVSEVVGIDDYLPFTSPAEKEKIGVVHIEHCPSNYKDYKVSNSQLVKLTAIESQELAKYRTILSAGERLINDALGRLRPSDKDVNKAENTIEILTLLSEVL